VAPPSFRDANFAYIYSHLLYLVGLLQGMKCFRVHARQDATTVLDGQQFVLQFVVVLLLLLLFLLLLCICDGLSKSQLAATCFKRKILVRSCKQSTLLLNVQQRNQVGHERLLELLIIFVACVSTFLLLAVKGDRGDHRRR
jgi:hypothetical protein